MSLMKNTLNIYNNSTQLSTQIMLNIVLEGRGEMTNKVKILRKRGKLVLGKRATVSISSSSERKVKKEWGEKEETGDLEEAIDGLCSFSSTKRGTPSW